MEQTVAAALQSELREADLGALLVRARALRDAGHGRLHSYSRKVFIPLTHLCRDVCHYCTFTRPPRPGEPAFLSRGDVLDIARAGAAAGCTEALFTLGEKPELRYVAAREALAALGHETTVSYLAEMCELVLKETGLLPHANPGTLTREEMTQLRRVSASQGMMLESISERLCERGGPHFGSPDKAPAVRLETIRLAGELQVPFTTGLLIGIGETREERLEALFALEALHRRYGHIQEIIIQNFRAKPNTKMAGAPDAGMDDMLWTIAAARIIFGPTMHIQAPPNLSDTDYPRLRDAGIDDWGGISPVTIDHVNPEAPWPEIQALGEATARSGAVLVPRLPIYPDFIASLDRWADPTVAKRVRAMIDTVGYARGDRWSPGRSEQPPVARSSGLCLANISAILARARAGDRLEQADIVQLFGARDGDYRAVCETADELRRTVSGDTIRYVVNRNINYTNICLYHCSFCAFSKGRGHANMRGAAYDLDLDEVARRVAEAWDRGATEVCMQGGIHPRYTGETYLALCRAAKAAAGGMHIHAFSPLEVRHGASTLGLSVAQFLEQLKDAGLASLPGTAAEILDDRIRADICPDKLNSDEWLETIEAAHRVGLPTTSTIMFGHVETYEHWAIHLLKLRDLQARTGGITEFVPLPFVPMEAPMSLRGRSRNGPTFREAVLMHAVARIVLHPLIPNIQTSWVKMGIDGALACLEAGANDFGGTLMNESISRAAGSEHGQEFAPAAIEAAIRSIGRVPEMRTTLYIAASAERRATAMGAAPLSPMIQTPIARKSAPQMLTA